MFKYLSSFFSNNNENEAKDIILKEVFNYSNQKKVVNKAAKDSAQDQREMVEKYRRVKVKQDCICIK